MIRHARDIGEWELVCDRCNDVIFSSTEHWLVDEAARVYRLFGLHLCPICATELRRELLEPPPRTSQPDGDR
jgi:hypothetical protein